MTSRRIGTSFTSDDARLGLVPRLRDDDAERTRLDRELHRGRADDLVVHVDVRVEHVHLDRDRRDPAREHREVLLDVGAPLGSDLRAAFVEITTERSLRPRVLAELQVHLTDVVEELVARRDLVRAFELDEREAEVSLVVEGEPTLHAGARVVLRVGERRDADAQDEARERGPEERPPLHGFASVHSMSATRPVLLRTPHAR
jgi:hypothetical protein